MKKLMFAAAAALCATLGYSDVESQNIVGYQNVDVPVSNGYYIFTPTFKNLGAEKKFDLKTITPLLPSGLAVGQNQKVTLYILAENGVYGLPVSWYGKSAMWTKNGSTAIADGEVMIGEGNGIAVKNTVMVNKDGSGVEVAKGGIYTPICFQVSGEVDLVCQNLISAKNGYVINGNSTPVEINIKNIVPRLPSGVAVGNNQKVTIYMLGDNGVYKEPISWYGKSSMWTKNGSSMISDADGLLASGQGFAIKNTVMVNKDGSGVEVAKGGNYSEIYLELPLPINTAD